MQSSPVPCAFLSASIPLFSPTMEWIRFDVRSLRDVQGLRNEAVGTESWDIRIIAVARIDEAPRMVHLLRGLRAAVAPQIPQFDVRRYSKLKTVSRISRLLGKVATIVPSLIANAANLNANRRSYRRLLTMANHICGAAQHLPRSGRRAIVGVGSRIRSVAKEGKRTGGGEMAGRLQTLLPLLADLQSRPLRIAPEEIPPAP
jgi:hypothetical protein